MTTTMHPRLSEEWEDITQIYPDLAHSSVPERLEATVDLAPGLYNQSVTKIAVLIPPGYRATGPDGFLVPSGLQLTNGGIPASDASGAGMPGWLLVSFHMVDEQGNSTWQPTADPRCGDNIIGYFQSIEAFFARGCN